MAQTGKASEAVSRKYNVLLTSNNEAMMYSPRVARSEVTILAKIGLSKNPLNWIVTRANQLKIKMNVW